jgi:Lon protease (S16) C-terminal proteolytic domain
VQWLLFIEEYRSCFFEEENSGKIDLKYYTFIKEPLARGWVMRSEFEEKYQNLPFAATILVYLNDLYLYLMGFISGFHFVNVLFLINVFFMMFLIYIRKIRIPKRIFVFSTVVSFLLFIYEFPIVLLDELQYIVTGYHEPEEVIKGTSIFLLGVTTFEIGNVENEQKVREMFTHNQKESFYEIKSVTNPERYISKNLAVFEFIGIRNHAFEQMSENVSAYLKTSKPVIDEFLSRENSAGDSAGLGLVLSGILAQKEINNDVPIGITGAITKTGKVKYVGGIKEKVRIASENNFSHMIIPYSNLTEANEIKEKLNLPIKIIGVRNVDDAVKITKEINNEK